MYFTIHTLYTSAVVRSTLGKTYDETAAAFTHTLSSLQLLLRYDEIVPSTRAKARIRHASVLTTSPTSPPVISLTPSTTNPIVTEHLSSTNITSAQSLQQPSPSLPNNDNNDATPITILHPPDSPPIGLSPESIALSVDESGDHTPHTPVADDAYFNTQLVCCDQYLLSADVSFDNATKMIKTLYTLLQSVYIPCVSYTLHIIYTAYYIHACILYTLRIIYTVYHVHCILYTLRIIYTAYHIHCVSYTLRIIYTVYHVHCVSYTLCIMYTAYHIHFVSYTAYTPHATLILILIII